MLRLPHIGARSPADVMIGHPQLRGCTLWYYLNDDSVRTCRDFSGRSRNGTITYSYATAPLTWVTGREREHALHFEGLDSTSGPQGGHVVLPTLSGASSYVTATAGGMSAWVYCEGGTVGPVLAFAGQGQSVVALANDSGGGAVGLLRATLVTGGGIPDSLYGTAWSGSGKRVTLAAVSAVANAWHHIWMSWDGTNLYGGLDGQLTDSVACGSVTFISGGSRIGKGDSNQFGGSIQDVRVYNRALSTDDAYALYANPLAPFRSSRIIFLPDMPGEVVPPVVLGTDTIRGGGLLVPPSRGRLLLDTTRDRSLMTTSFPSGWTDISTGSGDLTPDLKGLTLDSGASAGAVAGLQSNQTYQRFDIAVDVTLVHPTGPTTAPVDLLVLEVGGSSGAVAQVRLQRGVGTDPSATVVRGDASGGVVGGVALAPAAVASVVTLRIVRNLSRLFAFAGIRSTRGGYETLVTVLDYDGFSTGAGPVRIYAANGGVSGRVRSVVSNFTVRSHAIVGDRLLVDKLDLGARRIAGNVPATTVASLGMVDVSVFGLFGEVLYPDGFRYTLPPERTLGRGTGSSLFTVQDPALRDRK